MTTISSKHIDVLLGDALRRHRRAAGLTQAELGRAAGVTFQQVQKYERGHNRVSVSRLFQLATPLGIDPTALVAELQAAVASPRPSATVHSIARQE